MSLTRFEELKSWLNTKYNNDFSLTSLNNDASFRKYYRFKLDKQSLIAVDSPPDKENNLAFISIGQLLLDHNVTVPKVINKNIDLGFFVLEDLGDNVILPILHKTNDPENLYDLCLEELFKLQACSKSNAIDIENKFDYKLPCFDKSLLSFEMELFREWFLAKYLKLDLAKSEQDLLDKIFAKLIETFYEQPQVLVHRDFHSRNLIYTDSNKMGVIDFQDALWGPLTYDLVSLYRDCYISWPLNKVKEWCLSYFNKAKDKNIINNSLDFDQYWHWFLLTTLQRNFKTIGIFSRLYIRDHKSGYLNDIPRTLSYALDVTKYFAENNKNSIYYNIYNLLNNKVLAKLESTKSKML